MHRPRTRRPTRARSILARTWLQQQIAAYQTAGGAAGGITDGVEGNVSTYFALVAAGATASAQAMSEFLTTQAWDTRERRLRMGVKDWGLAIDVTGNWGSEFFRQIQDNTRALNGLNLAAESSRFAHFRVQSLAWATSPALGNPPSSSPDSMRPQVDTALHGSWTKCCCWKIPTTRERSRVLRMTLVVAMVGILP